MPTTWGFIGDSDGSGEWFSSTKNFSGSATKSYPFLGQNDHSGEWFASTKLFCGSATKSLPYIGQKDNSGEWFSSSVYYDSAAEKYKAWIGANDAALNWVGAIYMGNILLGTGSGGITVLPVPSVETPPLVFYQSDGVLPPISSPVAGNVLTVYYSTSAADALLLSNFNAGSAWVQLAGDNLPTAWLGIFQVIAMGHSVPYNAPDALSRYWFQVTVTGSPAAVYQSYSSVPSVEEIPMAILQCNVGAHPRPGDGLSSLPPGNIVTVYYNDIHDRSGPDTDLNTAFATAGGAYIYLSGGTLPAQLIGVFKVTAIGADKPYHDDQDTHNWFQFICGPPSTFAYAQYPPGGPGAQYVNVISGTFDSTARYQQVLGLSVGFGFTLKGGFKGLTWMKNVVVMSRDYWDISLGTPYSGQLFPHGGNSPSPGQVFPY